MTDDITDCKSETQEDCQGLQPTIKKRKSNKSAWKDDNDLEAVLSSMDAGTGESTSAQSRDADKAIKDLEVKLLNKIGDTGDSGTHAARQEEEERLKRVEESVRQHYESIKQQKQQQLENLQIPKFETDQFDDFICLSSDDEDVSDDQSIANSTQPKQEVYNHPLIELDSDDEDKTLANGVNGDSEEFNVNTCGIHANDSLNIPDIDGRILVNVGHPPEDPKIYLSNHIASIIKPHQIGGVRFMYDNIVENQSKFETSSGFGCILAHSMGLGKTFQIISFVDVFLTHTSATHVLCIVPINVLQNWISEYEMWLPTQPKIDQALQNNGCNVPYRTYKTFALTSELKTFTARVKEILEWHRRGGVLLMGYEIFRLLVCGKLAKTDNVTAETFKKLQDGIHKALINPGPNLVVCDEGHRIKNAKASISKALKQIATKRRIVMTGYPLQNNMMEYWCMVDFVRPNYLGSDKEFTVMFEKPIKAGELRDACELEKRIMRYRAHVLYTLLKGFVQRRSHVILKNTLPSKHEHVILIRMTSIQKQLMNALIEYMMTDLVGSSASSKINPIILFSMCTKIWNHPDVMYTIAIEGKQDVSDDTFDLESLAFQPSRASSSSNKERSLEYTWSLPFFEHYTPLQLESSYKAVILFEIIHQCFALGEKLLVFSQSLYTLDLIEKLLGKIRMPNGEEWSRSKNYLRLDGSTNSLERDKLVNNFNSPNSKYHLFLLSTRAGSLGINLVGANRIVVFDASWNPCHDAQAACRIYRYGQYKECHIYRLVCDNSLEKKIYDRQVSKQGMSHRVIDEVNVQSMTSNEINKLVENLWSLYEPPVKQYSEQELEKFSDPIIKHLCTKFSSMMTDEPFEHESLFLDDKETELSARDKHLAQQEYLARKNERNSDRHNIYNYGNHNSYYGDYGSFNGGQLPLRTPMAGISPLSQISNNLSLQLRMKGFTHQKDITLTYPLVLQDKSTHCTTTIPVGENVLLCKNPVTKEQVMLSKCGKVIEVKTQLTPTNGSNGLMPSVSGFTPPNILHNGQKSLLAPRPIVRPNNGPPEVVDLIDDDD